MRIIDLRADDERAILQAAELLVDGFREDWPGAWPDIESALREVRESFAADRISRIAPDENGDVAGWIGGISAYDGHTWEVHPLVVRRDRRRRGIGSALVNDLEDRVRERGGCTMYLGTDDVSDMTSLSGIDLYPNPLEHLAAITTKRRHPHTFYQRLGFVIVGMIPDANGPGKPDIFMAKRVASTTDDRPRTPDEQHDR